VVYQGGAAKALDYFGQLDYTCAKFNSPPDFFLDVINHDAQKHGITCVGPTP
jgi:hypothetical protein